MVWRRTARDGAGHAMAADEGAGEGAICEACAAAAQVVEVGFADQAGANPLFGGVRKQYVNFRRPEIRLADTELVSDNQIGQTPPIFLRVTPARATPVRVKLTRTMEQCDFPTGSANRSTRERGLHHLGWTQREHRYTTEDNGELLIEPGLHISAIGGGEYRVHAAPVGGAFVASTNTVRIKRRLYIQPVVRHAAARALALGAINALVAPLEQLDLEVRVLPPVDEPELGVQMVQELPQSLVAMGAEALDATAGQRNELRPHSVAVIVGKFCEEREWLPGRLFGMDLVPDPETGRFDPQVMLRLADDDGRSYFTIPLQSGAQFISCTLTGDDRFEDIDRAAVSGLDGFTDLVDVDISAALAAFEGVAALRLELTVRAIRTWGVGWAYNEHPVIYLNMHSPATDALIDANRAQALIIHELGHKLHLTGRSQGGQPDRQRHHYGTFNSHGVHHVGHHCSTGVPSGTALWRSQAREAATCTMWGALKGTTTFCDECKTTLRKVDLADGY